METRLEPQLNTKQQQAFSVARQVAGKTMRRRVRMYRLLRNGYQKLARKEKNVAQIADDLRTLFRLARRWTRKEYRMIPWRSMLYGVAAIIYFVNPVDLIPDAIVGLGFLDDIAVVGAIVKAIQKDLDDFRWWEEQQLPASETQQLG
jgi:uncharacterized membrane protein YkvA (DUF1232 family)